MPSIVSQAFTTPVRLRGRGRWLRTAIRPSLLGLGLLLADGAQAACIGSLDDARTIMQVLANVNGIGGTGLGGGEDDGIGGTGLGGESGGPLPGAYDDLDDDALDQIRAAGENERESQQDGQRIRGVITSLDEVCPLGVRIELDGGSVVDDRGRDASARGLRIGQVVEVDAITNAASSHALIVRLRPVIEGPVTALEAPVGVLEVMGERIEVGPLVPIEEEATAMTIRLGEIRVGDSVVVHGARTADGRVFATWLARSQRSDVASVRGIARSLEARPGGMLLRIGRVRVAATWAHDEAISGQGVTAIGHWDAASTSLTEAQVIGPAAGAASARADAPRAEWAPDVRLHLGHWPPRSER